jgi:hypothetical protein
VDESFEVVVPPELEAGVYAEDLAGWLNGHALVLDFLAQSSEAQRLVTVRIRVPATAALEVRRALDRVIREYELQYGEIHRPRKRGEP